MLSSSKAKGFFLIFMTGLLWGPNFLFIKVAVSEVPPVTLVFLRLAIGAGALFLISLFQKIGLWQWRQHWKVFALMGISMNVIPFLLITHAELYISSALTGILNSLAIIFTAVIAHYFGPHDPLTKNRIAGIFSGVLGLTVIYAPLLWHKNAGSILGVLMMILASLSYGVGIAYVRTHLQKIPSMTALTAQMIASAVILLPFSLIIDHPFSLPFPSMEAVYSLLALGAIGSGVSFIFYYKAIEVAGGTYATLSVFLLAIFAILFGALFLHEQISWNEYIGTFFILLGLVAVNPAPVKK